jgi:hypothetical protein
MPIGVFIAPDRSSVRASAVAWPHGPGLVRSFLFVWGDLQVSRETGAYEQSGATQSRSDNYGRVPSRFHHDRSSPCESSMLHATARALPCFEATPLRVLQQLRITQKGDASPRPMVSPVPALACATPTPYVHVRCTSRNSSCMVPPVGVASSHRLHPPPSTPDVLLVRKTDATIRRCTRLGDKKAAQPSERLVVRMDW